MVLFKFNELITEFAQIQLKITILIETKIGYEEYKKKKKEKRRNKGKKTSNPRATNRSK